MAKNSGRDAGSAPVISATAVAFLFCGNSLMADLGLITTGGSDTSYFNSPSAFLMRLIASTMFSSLVA